jgi:hypothetical protein
MKNLSQEEKVKLGLSNNISDFSEKIKNKKRDYLPLILFIMFCVCLVLWSIELYRLIKG